ncbi:Na+/H+ antiporter subunit G [Pseudooceanicola sp. LIPI14-2-Ac024]|uniref:Na+/H+ antiporter subunit G n=1 Tax=Pseudooceanicola sp. LIPI14-2-Ac024 TaxID=3344875 RepID=UPI0035CF1B62
MDLIAEILISFFLVVAGIFGFVGSYGLLKLRDTMQRLHAPTKATTVGVGGVLIASMLYFLLIDGHVSFHELMITIFLFLTAPISANFIAKTFLIEKRDEVDIPGTQCDFGWSISDDPPNVKDAPQE